MSSFKQVTIVALLVFFNDWFHYIDNQKQAFVLIELLYL